ncbi:DUF5990 family protein [Rudanella lutea]|jgi:hypothetical protein|uniref:DUF5990 family protein n=1 Tax=Rudanella lutea TaxID=451374 RepID=UPI0003607B10|nr:DUF5990 family protein [Rudanella lutea]
MGEQTITIRISIQKPVSGLMYGLQKGSGTKYETVQKQLAGTDDLCFEVELTLKENRTGELTFYGPYAQGPANERFLYVDMGHYAGQINAPTGGRLKVPLPNIDDTLKQGALHGSVLRARVAGRKEQNGSPNTGTVKPLGGWEIEK